jgi:hypothetical protein
VAALLIRSQQGMRLHDFPNDDGCFNRKGPAASSISEMPRKTVLDAHNIRLRRQKTANIKAICFVKLLFSLRCCYFREIIPAFKPEKFGADFGEAGRSALEVVLSTFGKWFLYLAKFAS